MLRLAAVALALAPCLASEEASKAPHVIFTCEVAPEGNLHKGVKGTFWFEAISRGHDGSTSGPLTRISYEVRGLIPHKKHGIHVHEKANFHDGCASTGDHFNPFGFMHGDVHFKFKHLGDLGNILADASGVAKGSNLISDVPLSGRNTIVGRAIVVHEREDDLGLGGDDSSRAAAGGNAGGRKYCGKIVRVVPRVPRHCPRECRHPFCQSGRPGFHGWKELSHGVCTHYCSGRFGHNRFCGDGSTFKGHGFIDCTGCSGGFKTLAEGEVLAGVATELKQGNTSRNETGRGGLRR